ncbi:MAG: hypothetical protein HS111_19950 [Kofleriaceae bacterium]|nr:hypothetical protein [Kofleriaceae bacterium]MCL4225210.1 hypothetical protein [Myxococcales bacterium]
MPLDPVSLALGLRQRWLPAEGGFPSSVDDSAGRFADVVAPWFGAGAASGFPCATAMARKSQLAGAAAAALATGDARGAGQQLALALAQYMAGQTFGAGVSALPVATPALVLALGEVFAAHDLDDDRRATLIAAATHLTAVSTIVTFPTPIPPSPVL